MGYYHKHLIQRKQRTMLTNSISMCTPFFFLFLPCHLAKMGKQWKQWQTLFWGAPKSLQMVTAAMKFKDACSLEEKLSRQHIKSRQHINLDSILKSRDITLPAKVHLVTAMVFPVVMYGCESWTRKKAEHQRIDAFELWCWKILESPLDSKEIQPVHPKGNQS